MQSLEDELTRRFQDFKKVEPDLNLISFPFSAEIDTVPENLQLELIDLQSNHTLKGLFHSVTLTEFYNSLSLDEFLRLKNFAMKIFSIFGSTYICEQTFSSMKIIKSKNRSSLADINLEALMKISTSNLIPQKSC